MADQVKFGADAREYFTVVDQMRAKLNELGVAHQRVGDIGFANEYRVDRQARFLTSTLIQAKSAGEGAGAALTAFALAADLPLGVAIAGVVAGEAILKIAQESEKAKKAYLELEVELAKPVDVEVHQSAEAIGADLDKLVAKTKALRTEHASIGATLLRGLGAIAPFHAPLGQEPDVQADAIAAADARAKVLADARADAELRVAEIKQQGLQVSTESAAMDKAQLDFENARAKILATAFVPGADIATIFKRLAALEVEKRVAVETARAKETAENTSLAHARVLADLEALGLNKRNLGIAALAAELALRKQILIEAQKLGNIKGIAAADVGLAAALAQLAKLEQQFVGDVGSGKFVANLAQERQQAAQEEAGRALIDELRRARAQNVALGPNAQQILAEADALEAARGLATGQKDFSSINLLAGKDFSGLAAIGNLPFEGLNQLNNLSVTIK